MIKKNSNEFYNYSLYSKYVSLSAMKEAKISIASLCPIQKAHS